MKSKNRKKRRIVDVDKEIINSDDADRDLKLLLLKENARLKQRLSALEERLEKMKIKLMDYKKSADVSRQTSRWAIFQVSKLTEELSWAIRTISDMKARIYKSEGASQIYDAVTQQLLITLSDIKNRIKQLVPAISAEELIKEEVKSDLEFAMHQVGSAMAMGQVLPKIKKEEEKK